MAQPSYTTRLNNYLQGQRREHELAMTETNLGNAWRIQYKVNGQLIGDATAPNKTPAKEEAAKAALIALGITP